MNLFFEKLTIFAILTHPRYFLPAEKILYVDADRFCGCLTRLFPSKIEKLDFRLIEIKDEKGDLIRIKLHNGELTETVKRIKESLLKSYDSASKERAENFTSYLAKSVIGNIMIAGTPARIFYLIEVIAAEKSKRQIDEIVFFVKTSPFYEQAGYLDYAKKKGIGLKFLSPLRIDLFKAHFEASPVGLYHLFRSFFKQPFLIRLFAGINSIRSFSARKRKKATSLPKPKLLLELRENFSFSLDASVSDFSSVLYGPLKFDDIVVHPHSPLSVSDFYHLLDGNIVAVARKFIPDSRIPFFYLKRILYRKSRFPNSPSRFFFDRLFIRRKTWDYDYTYNYLIAFCRTFGVKVFLSWFFFEEKIFAYRRALEKVGGFFILQQLAYQDYEAYEYLSSADVFFVFSRSQARSIHSVGSQVGYFVVTGFTQKYCTPSMEAKVEDLRSAIKSEGAEKIIACFDENSYQDSRWHTGDELQQEHYFHLLNEVLENPRLGVVFKPKSPATLKRRLGKVYALLKKAEYTGRCKVLDSSNNHRTSDASVSFAAMAGDLVIHSCAAAGTCAMISAHLGKPTIMIDIEGWSSSLWYSLKENPVVFKNWEDALEGSRNFLFGSDPNPDFGNCQPLKKELDPFGDDRGPERIGEFTQDLLEGFGKKISREENLSAAIENYVKKWGKDKVLTSESFLGEA